MNIHLNIRLGLGILVTFLFLIFGFWTVGYFELNTYEKGIIKEFQKVGLSCDLKGRATSGFPYMVSRSYEQVVLSGHRSGHAVFISIDGASIKKTVISPGKIFFDAASVRGSFDREHHINLNNLALSHATPAPNAGIADVLSFVDCEITSHGQHLAKLGKTTLTQGIKNGTLYCKNDICRPSVDGKEFSSFEASAFLETPQRNWHLVQSCVIDGALSLLDDIEFAVHTGNRTLPLVKKWIDHMEETQTALHGNFLLRETDGIAMHAKYSLGIVEGMPSGKVSLQGDGEWYKQLPWKNTDWDFRKEGIFANGRQVIPFSDVPLDEQHIINESLICDTFALYPHGLFRQLLAEGDKVTEKPDVQFTIGEGYLVDGNFTKALTWLKRAAIQKHPQALLHLGYMYYAGLGCEEDKQLAREFTEDSVCFGGNTYKDLQDFEDAIFRKWVSEVTGEVIAEGKSYE